jgi:hypothetical protein
MEYSELLREELQNCGKINVFEVQVLNKKTNEEDYVVFDIEIIGNQFRAYHVPLTKQEVKSQKIAFEYIEVCEDGSLDGHLHDLYDACMTAILDSEFYDLV